jgi:hypothetical protein
MPEAIYGDMAAADRHSYEEHLARCPDCVGELANLEYAVSLTRERRRPQVPEEFWEQTWATFVKRLEQSGGGAGVRSRFPRSWILNLAAAAALIAVGIFIGRFYWSTPPAGLAPPQVRRPMHGPGVALDDRIDRYLERTKLLLMSVDNFDVDAQHPDQPYLVQGRNLSRSLLAETAVLKNDLQASREELLLELVSQLEVILLQISNLRDAQASIGIEMARTGIHDRALLFRINLEEMHRAGARLSGQKKARENPARRVG